MCLLVFAWKAHPRYRLVMAANRDEFMDLIRKTIDDGGLGTPEERRAAVLEASWDRRAAQLLAVCEGG